MIKSVTSTVLLACVSLLVFAVPSIRGATVLSTSGGSTRAEEDIPVTVGWSFTTPSTALTVTALDAILNGSTTSTIVRLYNGAGTILATTTVTTSDPTETSGFTWYSHVISPVVLPTSTTLYIAEDIPANLALFYNVQTSSPVMSNGLTFGSPVSVAGTGGTPTSDSFDGGAPSPSYFGPNFDVAAPTSTPLPAAVWEGMSLCALLGTWKLVGRTRMLRRRMV